MQPIVLGTNRPSRFYRGGALIDAFRGQGSAGPDLPEDWVASTTTLFGERAEGLTSIGGRTLRDLVRADPVGWLGQDHLDRTGADPGLLVKLLAAEQRLPIHLHPSRAFAGRWLSSRWGKTESWIILEPGASGDVWLGWRMAIDADDLRHAVNTQDTGPLLERMNRLHVGPGDTVLVPAGTPHAIGPGMLILEVQEPTDFSILLEWRGFPIDGERDAHLGLGFDVALGAVTMGATPDDLLSYLVRHPVDDGERPTSLLPPDADPFFRAERMGGGSAWMPAGFGVLVVTSGDGWIESAEAAPIAVRSGMTLAIPAGAGSTHLAGEVTAICCRSGQ